MNTNNELENIVSEETKANNIPTLKFINPEQEEYFEQIWKKTEQIFQEKQKEQTTQEGETLEEESF